jgi:hypothetical protein
MFINKNQGPNKKPNNACVGHGSVTEVAQIGNGSPPRDSRMPLGRWLRLSLLVAAMFAVTPKSFALVEVMRPALYLGQRAQAPTQSPFAPFAPQPLLDFQPFPPKPQIKTPQELGAWGYLIWQPWAYREYHRECYDPITEAYVGWIYTYWEWDVNLGYRLQHYTDLNGVQSFSDSGWGWSGAGTWNRQEEGYTHQIRPWYFSDPYGYKSYGVVFSDAEWKLKNFGGPTSILFELTVGWDVKKWPYSWYLSDAYAANEVKFYTAWRVIACPRGSTVDITSRYHGIPMNHRLTAEPYLKWGWSNVTENNSELPEWVEGWEG